MELKDQTVFVIISEQELLAIKETLNKILSEVSEIKKAPFHPSTNKPGISPYISAKEFMDAVRIKRTKFDSLIAANKIKTIKKSRRIYVLASEVERYFKDPDIA
jgi:hypothetical protein